jgi:hypothetical protein
MQRGESPQPGLAAVGFSMQLFVTFSAQRDQVLFLVATRLTSEFEMVYLQALHATADLASPSVAF